MLPNIPDILHNYGGRHADILAYCLTGNLQRLRMKAEVLSRIINDYFPDGQTCLIAACRNGHTDVVAYLVEDFKANIEQTGTVEFESEQVEGVTPLWCAAATGRLWVVRLLLSYGADVNRATLTNSTPLRAACFDGHLEVVRVLLRHGADVEIMNRHGHTCLMISCYRRHDEIVKELLDHKARVNRRSAKGNTALHDCAESMNIKSMNMLLNHGAIMRRDEFGLSPIMSGANCAYKKVVDSLIQYSDSLANQPNSPNRISFEEQIASMELLGASLFDRHMLVQDALAAWFNALNMRQSAGLESKLSTFPYEYCDCNQRVFSSDPNDCLVVNDDQHLCQRSSTRRCRCIWSLLAMAGREAIAAEQSHPQPIIQPAIPDYLTDVEFESPSRKHSVSHRCELLYQAKRDALQKGMYVSYHSELQRVKQSSDLIQTNPPMTYAPTTARLSSAMVPRDPIIGMGQPSSPADPSRCVIPLCWTYPRYRIALTSRYSSSAFKWKKRSCSPVVPSCAICQRPILIIGGSRSPSSVTYCVGCKISSESPEQPVQLSSSTPDKRIISNRPSTFLVGAKYLTDPCPSCQLIQADHPGVQRLRRYAESAFGHAHEFGTVDELNAITTDIHALRLQPLLIRLRILGPDHPDTIYYIRGAIYADSDNFWHCLNLWRYALELQRLFLEPLCHVSQATFVSFAELLYHVLNSRQSGVPVLELRPSLVVDCLELAVDNIERGIGYSYYQWHQLYPWSYSSADKEALSMLRHVSLCLHLISLILQHYYPKPVVIPARSNPLLTDVKFDWSKGSVIANCRGPPSRSDSTMERLHNSFTDFQKQRFLDQVFRLVHLDPRVHSGQNLVHLACAMETGNIGRLPMCRFPNSAVLSLLLTFGANPNCVDANGERPLMIVLRERAANLDEHRLILTYLIKHGAHLDATSRSTRECALDYKYSFSIHDAGINRVQHTTLACLAARKLRKMGLDDQKGRLLNLPPDVIAFIDMH